MPDAIVVGGGVIGLSIAWELADAGLSVTVLDRGEMGAEASWAGAGMLPDGNPEHATTTEGLLRGWSRQLWAKWAERLFSETGIETGYRECGGLHLAVDDIAELEQQVEQWNREGVDCRPVSSAELADLEPAVSRDLALAVSVPGVGQVRNPRLLKALVTACSQRGVELLPHTEVRQIEVEQDRIAGVRTDRGLLTSGLTCLTSGAWTGRLLQQLECELPLVPMRGQIVLLSTQPRSFSHVLESGKRYLVPRPDGRILIGSTEEAVGFCKQNTAAGIAGLLEFAERLVPGLATARFERAWSGLRPYLPDELPVLDRLPGYDNAFVAAGHFRAGLSLSPVTAVLIRQMILGQPPLFDLSGLSLDRFQGQRVTVDR